MNCSKEGSCCKDSFFRGIRSLAFSLLIHETEIESRREMRNKLLLAGIPLYEMEMVLDDLQERSPLAGDLELIEADIQKQIEENDLV